MAGVRRIFTEQGIFQHKRKDQRSGDRRNDDQVSGLFLGHPDAD